MRGKDHYPSIGQLSHKEKAVFIALSFYTEVDEDVYREILKGAQVHIPGDDLYYTLYSFEDIYDRERLSSHQSVHPQFALRGPFMKECLIGTREYEGQTYTWFQFERHKAYGDNLFDSIFTGIAHLFDWVLYKITGSNIGPYGRSHYVEKTPLYLCLIESGEGKRFPGSKPVIGPVERGASCTRAKKDGRPAQ